MTPNEITAVIASSFNRELDIPFRLQLMARVTYWRSRLVANSLRKNPAERKFFTQVLYLPMEQALSTPCAPDVACLVARTTDKIPDLIRWGSSLFSYVGGVDGASPFREVTSGTGNYVATSRFADQFPTYSFSGEYITTPKSDLPMIRVESIFADPFLAATLSCSDKAQVCDTWNTDYPLTGEMLQLIVQSILSTDYRRLVKDDDKEDLLEIKPQADGYA